VPDDRLVDCDSSARNRSSPKSCKRPLFSYLLSFFLRLLQDLFGSLISSHFSLAISIIPLPLLSPSLHFYSIAALSQPRRHVCESMTKSPASCLDTDSIAQFFIENPNVGNQSHLEDSRSAYTSMPFNCSPMTDSNSPRIQPSDSPQPPAT